MSLLEKPDFTENEVALALEMFLTTLTFPRQRFSIELFSHHEERKLGADALVQDVKIKGFKPFYMQFKRPEAYPAHSSAEIIGQRKTLGASIAPRALFFQLRKKQESHIEFQHNVLFRLQKKYAAAYICPLFLNRKRYINYLHKTALLDWLIYIFKNKKYWIYGDKIIKSPTQPEHIINTLKLTAHVCIPPHTEVTSASHKYSFSEIGDEICFHSPELLHQGGVLLEVFLERILGNSNTEQGFITAKTSDEHFREILKDISKHQDDNYPDFHNPLESGENNWLGNWRKLGNYLNNRYRIQQFAYVDWGDWVG